MIDFGAAVMGGRESPDIRQFPVGAKISRVDFAASPTAYERGNVNVEFTNRRFLPDVDLGHAGLISWTLWFGFNRGGTWVFAPMVECRDGYIPTGALFDSNQVANNLLYYADALDPRIARYQPKIGEQIAVVATSGDTRRMSKHAREPFRTDVVLVPFAVGDYRFDLGPIGSEPSPAPEPIPNPAPPPPVVPALDLSPVIDLLKKIESNTAAAAQSQQATFDYFVKLIQMLS